MFRFLFQAAFLCVVSPLCRHTTCPTTTAAAAAAAAPPTRILSRYLQKGAPGHRVQGIGWGGWERGGEVRGKGGGKGIEGGRRRLSGPFISGLASLLLHLPLTVLPMVEP